MALSKDLPYSPEDVIKYLRNHSDFFVKHTDILSELSIPHNTTGNITSLIEYQVAQLRQKNTNLNENIEKSEEDVLHQRELAKNLHGLSLR